MPTTELSEWIDEHSKPGRLWFAKRLSANDTGLTGGHQYGPLIAKDVLFEAFPSLDDIARPVPDCQLDFFTDSHSRYDNSRAVWYWSKTEGRITRVGGQQSPFLDPDNTGELAVFVFLLKSGADCSACHAWVCGGEGLEADIIEELVGDVEPKQFVVWRPGSSGPVGSLFSTSLNCALAAHEIPPQWMSKFPSGEEIIAKALSLRGDASLPVDRRLVNRRECEFQLFQSVEKEFWLPKVTAGASTIDQFLALAQSILQSRKSRAGNSLELHTREILKEEGFHPGVDFQHKPVTEHGKKPDFIFPSQSAYEDPAFPAAKLRMLAAKTTCKDRWRQVMDEADRIPVKHLLTLQEGLSESQFAQMKQAGIVLVVPEGIQKSYPVNIRADLLTVERFLAELRLTQSS